MEDCYECEICGNDILARDSVIRIAAEASVEPNADPHSAVVFAIFHSSCVVETYDDRNCDHVPFVDEAREMIQTSSLCDCCSDKIEPSEAPGLKLLRGGLS